MVICLVDVPSECRPRLANKCFSPAHWWQLQKLLAVDKMRQIYVCEMRSWRCMYERWGLEREMISFSEISSQISFEFTFELGYQNQNCKLCQLASSHGKKNARGKKDQFCRKNFIPHLEFVETRSSLRLRLIVFTGWTRSRLQSLSEAASAWHPRDEKHKTVFSWSDWALQRASLEVSC